jgi:hypothetical protein
MDPQPCRYKGKLGGRQTGYTGMLIPNRYTDQDQPIAIRKNIHRQDGLEGEGPT